MRALVLAALVSLAPLTAHADAAKAWSTAKAALPVDTAAVVNINVSALTKSPLFVALLPVILKKKPELQSKLDDIKRLCQLDMMDVVQGVVVALDADSGKGVVYIAVGKLDQPKLAACLHLISVDKKVPEITFTRTGNIVEAVEDKQKIYYAWAASDVIAFALDIHDRAELEKWTGGKGGISKSKVGPVLGKATTTAPIWGASGVEKPADPTLPMKSGYGSIKFTSGNVVVDFHAGMKNAKDATTGSVQANTNLSDAKKNLPAGVADLLKGITVTSVGDEVVIKMTASEKDLATMAPLLGMM